MATKTDRILSYLPGTFRSDSRDSALFAVVDAFGNELLSAENSLAAIMSAHWVDHADRGAELIDDLIRIGALYGLAPRDDESVEEFREHLKRYVRTFLEGTVTVQGILRVTAEALGIRIADANTELDSWWNSSRNELITIVPRGDDAAEIILGIKAMTVRGNPATSAQVIGTVDLLSGVDVRDAHILSIKVDNHDPVDIDLQEGIENPSSATLEEIINTINKKIENVAHKDGQYLKLVSPTSGPSSRLEIKDVDKDVAYHILGLPPRKYQENEAKAAHVTATVDLSTGVNLSEERYIRLSIDKNFLVEIDCAGVNPSQTTLNEIRDAINSALGFDMSSHNGQSLILTSPTVGFESSIAFQQPAAQNATERIFGAVNPFYLGHGIQSASFTGTSDLSNGVDLSERSKIEISIDDGDGITIDCAGADPVNTVLQEIVFSINTALGKEVARQNGRNLILTSPTTGEDSNIIIGTPPESDATREILGLDPRSYKGSAPTSARIIGKPDLNKIENDEVISLWARNRLLLGFDEEPPVEIDLRTGVTDIGDVKPDELRDAINAALKADIAYHDGHHLILKSPTVGSSSSLVIEPLEVKRHRRFVTRAMVIDEATQKILGFISRDARGTAATIARLIGKADLSRGIDLREERYLRISMDKGPAVDIDCAGKRPRATLIEEVIKKINDALNVQQKEGKDIATHNGRHVILNSTTPGADSRIAFEPPRANDALDVILQVEPGTYRGQEATKISFTGTENLSEGIELPGNAAIKVRIDGSEFHEISFENTEPTLFTLNQIMIKIIVKFNASIASSNGTHLILTSLQTGEASQIEFDVPEGVDVTKNILGFNPPRLYKGQDARPAMITGGIDLSNGNDLLTKRFLLLSVDDSPPEEVVCAAKAADPNNATIGEIVESINEVFPSVASTENGTNLILKSSTSGLSSRITLEIHTSGDARKRIFGDVPEVSEGTAPLAAVITGEVDLLSPVDLRQRKLLRLIVDGDRPIDIDVSGEAPHVTVLDEIIAAINKLYPGLASSTDDDRLRLTSPTAGEESGLSIVPLRYIDLIEYPAVTAMPLSLSVQHGDRWSIVNKGAADVYAEIKLTSSQGVFSPTLVNLTIGWRIRFLMVLGAGDIIRLWRDEELGLQGEITPLGEMPRLVQQSKIIVGPLDNQTREWMDRGTVLTLPRGKSEWLYMDCDTSRFNQAQFDYAKFAGGDCVERGVFNVSHFASVPKGKVCTVFASSGVSTERTDDIEFRWMQHQPGSFQVHLPSDLPDRFGGRFNEARFGLKDDAPEIYKDVVTEPLEDENHIFKLLKDSSLVKPGGRVEDDGKIVVEFVPVVPLGWRAIEIPFRKPQFLTLGDDNNPSRIYLAEEGVEGFIELRARETGQMGNKISITARKSGPAQFDITINFEGGRFENAREVVLGDPLPVLASELIKSGRIGILQAKAAGVKASVSREGTMAIP
jgi:hypothetical protein